MRDDELGFDEFFETGERLTDALAIVAFAAEEAARGDRDGAYLSLGWAVELLDQVESGDPALVGVLAAVRDERTRLLEPLIAARCVPARGR